MTSPYDWKSKYGPEPPENRFFHGRAERLGNMPFDPEDVKGLWIDILTCNIISIGHDFDSADVVEGVKYAAQKKEAEVEGA